MRDSRDHLRAPGGDGLADRPREDPAPVIYTVGHSTRPVRELIELLTAAQVRLLVDVRTVPRSRHNPQFASEALAQSLLASGIQYRHEPALGGFRRARPDSVNGGWQHPSFRGYADYMQSPEFEQALNHLMTLARERSTCIMCAEAQWWRCHRRLISDALVVRGWRVLHLGLRIEPVEHELTPFAVVGPDQTLTYPPLQGAFALE